MDKNKEDKEWEEKYKDRLKTPLEDYIKFESYEQMYELIMKKKKEKGLKFKDEK